MLLPRRLRALAIRRSAERSHRRLREAAAERGRLESELQREQDRRQADARRSLLSAMVADLASGFVNAPIESVDRAIRQSIQELCHAVRADRVQLAAWDASAQRLAWGEGWTHGVASGPGGRPDLMLAGLPGWLACANEGRILEIPRSSQLAAGDPLRRLLEGWGTGSLLALPLMEEERCTGFLVVEASGREHRWDQDEFAALVVAAELFSNSAMRRQREMALERALDETRSALRAKDAFLANMNHELRTPLNGVIGMARLLAGSGLPQARLEQVRTILDSADGLLRILDDLVDFARLEAGVLGLQQGDVDLQGLIGSVVATYAGSLDRGAVRLHGALAPGAPTAIRADRGRLRQVLACLVGNALRHTASGSVSVLASAAGGRLLIRVADTGSGIPAEMLSRLFRPFEQADSSHTRTRGGLGLGLAICQRVCRLMGGSVTAESTLGRGSVFTVDLPLVVAEAPPAPATDRAVRPKPRDGAFAAGAAVLLVEDHEVNRAVASAMLGGFGCLVDVAQDGIEAVRMAIAKPYRMVFMDIQMPRMDGLNATRAIRGHEARSGRQRTPIVGLTCLAHDDDRTRGLAAGMDAYLTKPIDPDEVAWVLERHLQAQSPTPDRTPAPSPDPTPGTDPVPVLDPAVAARLRGLADGLAASLWTEFAAELPARMAEITASAAAGDAAETHRLLHTLKGAAGTLGLTRLFRALARADELSRQQAAGWQAAATGLGPVCTESQAAARSAAGAAPG